MFPHDSYGFHYVSPNDITLCFISINISQFYRHRIYLHFHRRSPYASDNHTPSFYGRKIYYLKKEIRYKNLIN